MLFDKLAVMFAASVILGVIANVMGHVGFQLLFMVISFVLIVVLFCIAAIKTWRGERF